MKALAAPQFRSFQLFPPSRNSVQSSLLELFGSPLFQLAKAAGAPLDQPNTPSLAISL